MSLFHARRVAFFGAVLVLLLSPVLLCAADAAYKVTFFDEDGTTELQSIPTIESTQQPGKYYIDWKQLNNVPDFNRDETKVILTWKKQGDAEDRRFVLNFSAAYRPSASQTVPDPQPVLRENLVYLEEDLKLVPLKTISTAEFNLIHYGSIVVDGHTDAPMRIVDSTTWKPLVSNDLANVNDRVSSSQALYPWLKQGGLSGALHAAFNGGYPAEDFSRGSGDRANSRILALLNATHWSAERNPELIQLVTDSAGFQAAFDANRTGIMQSIESAYSLTEENYYELLAQYYDLGVRVLSFTWNYNSYLAAGNTMTYRDVDDIKVPGSAGMTELGKKALARMDQLGMVYDVSHTDDRTVRDALAATTRPIIASHSGARGEFDHERNLWDPEIVAIAQRGGMIFQNLYGDFMDDPRGVYEMVNQIDYIAALLEKPAAQGGAGFAAGTGVEYIGTGTDYDGGTNVADANDARYFYRITKELLARDYTKEEILNILGRNAFRVIDEVQARATIDNRGGTAVISSPTASGAALVRGVNFAQLNTRAPVFSATVTGAVSARVIVDGIERTSALSGNTLTASLAGTPLQEDFHVVTFEAADSNGKVTRNTSIFYVGDAAAVHKVEFMNPDRTTPIKTVYVNDGGAINAADIPETSADGKTVTGWTIYWTGQAFDTSTALARSYRLVAVTKSDSGGSSGGCNAAWLLAALPLLPVCLRRKRQ